MILKVSVISAPCMWSPCSHLFFSLHVLTFLFCRGFLHPVETPCYFFMALYGFFMENSRSNFMVTSILPLLRWTLSFLFSGNRRQILPFLPNLTSNGPLIFREDSYGHWLQVSPRWRCPGSWKGDFSPDHCGPFTRLSLCLSRGLGDMRSLIAQCPDLLLSNFLTLNEINWFSATYTIACTW